MSDVFHNQLKINTTKIMIDQITKQATSSYCVEVATAKSIISQLLEKLLKQNMERLVCIQIMVVVVKGVVLLGLTTKGNM